MISAPRRAARRIRGLPRRIGYWRKRRARHIGYMRIAAAEMSAHRAEAPNGRYVAYVGTAGLASRFRNHVIAKAFAERTGRTLIPHWLMNDNFPARWGDVFEPISPPDWRFSDRVTWQFILEDPRRPLDPFTLPDPDVSLVIIGSGWQAMLLDDVTRRIGGPRRWGELLRDVTPVAPTLQEIDERRRDWPAEVIGVHIRLGDYVTYGRAEPIKRYVDAAKKALEIRPDAAIALFSDGDPEALAPFLREFGDRVAYRPAPVNSAGRQPEVSVVDMHLLMACDQLVLPDSGFSYIAACRSGAPALQLLPRNRSRWLNEPSEAQADA